MNLAVTLRPLVAALDAFRCRAYDFRHKVKTCPRRGEKYMPTPARSIRTVLKHLGIFNFSDYVFVDIGSGKGRVLLAAAEFPFGLIIGVERSLKLHQIAQNNIRNYHGGLACRNIVAVNCDAREYEFPENRFFLYFFNPFGHDEMQRVLFNLVLSLRLKPREVFLIYQLPYPKDLVSRIPGSFLVTSLPGFDVYRVSAQAAVTRSPDNLSLDDDRSLLDSPMKSKMVTN